MTHYVLKLTFDLRQVTQSLNYDFMLADKNTPYPIKEDGPLAGTFNFQEGDKISVQVVALSAANADAPGSSPKNVLKNFAVTNCTFVSIPAKITQHLSLFDETNACAPVNDWSPAENISTEKDAENNLLRLASNSLKALPVVTKNGQWQISGYLSVALSAASGDKEAQLYFFDPEGSSGTGGGEGP